MVPAFIFGNASGASFNPALTIVLGIMNSWTVGRVIWYIIAEFAGAFLGAIIVYFLFKDHLDATEDSATKLGVFCTFPSIPNPGRNFFAELVATFFLVFSILGLAQVKGCATGVEKLLVFGILVSFGMSFGGLTGYAMNPARDLGPRIAHAVLPIKGKGDSNFKYGLTAPVFGPIVGALVAYGLYVIIPWAAK